MGASDLLFSGTEQDAVRTGRLAVYRTHLFDIGDVVAECDARFVRLSRLGWSRCSDSTEAARHVQEFLGRWAREGKTLAELVAGFGLVGNAHGEITHRIGFDGTLRVVEYVQCGPGPEATVPRVWQFTLADDEEEENREYAPGCSDTWAAFLMGNIKRRRPYADVRED